MIALLFSLAFGANIQKTGIADQDKLFAEVGNIDFVLNAADERIQRLLSEVAKPLKLPESTPLAYTVWTIKQQANGDIRMMVADERPILAVGDGVSKSVREAASALNEGTQEIAVMARDVARLPARMNELAMKSKRAKLDDALMIGNGLDINDKDRVQGLIDANRKATEQTGERAQAIAERAQALIAAVREGMSATEAPAGGPAATPAPSPAPTTAAAAEPAPKPKATGGVKTIGETVTEAWTQFNDAEMDAAVELLSQADLLLPRQNQPVPRADLLELFMVRSLVNLVKGDATAAAWSATQALVISPTSVPDSKFGPQYAKMHKALAKAGLVRKVEVSVTGDGRAYLSGVEVTGGSTLELGQGQHLLQIEKDGVWKSSIVYVADGFVVDL